MLCYCLKTKKQNVEEINSFLVNGNFSLGEERQNVKKRNGLVVVERLIFSFAVGGGSGGGTTLRDTSMGEGK